MATVRSAQIEFSANIAKLETGLNNATSSIRKFEKSFQSSFANIGGAIYTAQAAWAVMQRSFSNIEGMASVIEAEGIIDSLGKSVGKNSQTIVKDLLAVSEGMLSIQVATETAASAMAKGLDASALTGLAAASVTLSDAMGVTVNEAFAKLAEGITANKEKTIKLGTGVIDLKDKYGDLAASMTEAEKQQALLVEVLEKAQKVTAKLSPAISTLSDDIERMKSRASDMTLVFGAGLYTAINSVGFAFAMAGAGVWELAGALAKVQNILTLYKFDTLKQAEVFAYDARDAALKMAEVFGKDASLGFDVMTRKIEQMGQALNGGGDKMKAMGDASAAAQAKLSNMLSGKVDEEGLKRLQKMADALESWTEKIEALSPALNDHEDAVVKLWNEYNELKKKLEGNNEALQKAQKLMFQGLGFLEAKKAIAEYRKEVQVSIEQNEEQIKSLESLKQYYQSVYDYAIQKAQTFSNVAKQARDLFVSSQKVISGWKPDTRTSFEKLVADKDKIKDLFSKGFQSDNVEQVRQSLDGIGEFITKYANQKNLLGGNLSDVEDAQKMYEQLSEHVGRIADDNERFANSWNNVANQAGAAIDLIDSWIVEIQTQLSNLHAILNVDAAVQAAQYLAAQIDEATRPRTLVVNVAYAGQEALPVDNGGFSGGPDFSGGLSGYASGTNYVPRTGMYQLHQGEAVVPSNQNRGGVGTINAPITISGYSGDPAKLAKQIAMEIDNLREYGRVR